MLENELSPKARNLMIQEVIDQDQSISTVSKKYNVSRVTLYKWLKRYKNDLSNNKEPDMSSRKRKIDRYWRQSPDEYEDSVLSLVNKHPEWGIRTLVRNLPKVGNTPIVGHHGVQNILRRHNLSTYEDRLDYVKRLRTPVIRSIEDILKVISNFFKIPVEKRRGVIRLSGITLLFAFITVVFLGFINYISLSFEGTPVVSKFGAIFASTALLMGSFFFLYSLKYYLTLAIVLSYSQKETGKSNSIESRGGFINWLLGISKSNSNKYLNSKVTGLEPNLKEINLKNKPFISVQIPFYNEKNVVERSIHAAISFDYPAYEVILCDDSTDETTEIIKKRMERYLLEGEKLKAVKGDGWTLTSVEVKPGVTLKHLYRTARSGFKGGALNLALKLTDPKTEYVSIFDADFVPYPDSLELFLKYLKVENNMSEDYSLSNVAAVQGYQWHVLNKSENWITRGVRSEYSGSYVIERSGAEIYGGLKQISGSVYMIRKQILENIGWGTSITEDFELTLKLYEAGYKVVYTPYIQAPAECVSTLKRLIRQRMRWAEGHSFNIKRMFKKLMLSPKLTFAEKFETAYLTPYYLQAFFFLVGTLSWLISETIFKVRLPFWTELWGWSLVLTNMISLPLLNSVGLFLEESEERDYLGITSFVALSYVVVPFQAYAAVKGFIESSEGPWFRTPKTGKITDIFSRNKFYRFIQGIIPGKQNSPALEESYLALTTANNRFESFHIKSKGHKFIGNLVLTCALVTTITLSLLGTNIKTGSLADLPIQARVEKVGADTSFLTQVFKVFSLTEVLATTEKAQVNVVSSVKQIPLETLTAILLLISCLAVIFLIHLYKRNRKFFKKAIKAVFVYTLILIWFLTGQPAIWQKPLWAAAPNLDTMYPTAYSSQSGTAWTTTTVGNIDEGIAGADGVFIVAGANSTSSIFYSVTDTPSDFVKMITLNYNIRYKITPLSNDTEVLYVQVFKSDKTTALTNEMTVVSTTTAITITNKGSTAFTGVSTTATKAEWDAAYYRIRTTHAKSGGADNSVWSIDAFEMTGTYQLPPTVSLGTPTDTQVVTDTTPSLVFTGTDINSGDEIEYELQVDTVNTFNSTSSNGVVDNHTAPMGSSAQIQDGPTASNVTARGPAFTGNGNTLNSAIFLLANPFSDNQANIYAKIYNTTGTAGNKVPTGAALATSVARNMSTITGDSTYRSYNFTFSGANKITLTLDTIYIVTLEWEGLSTGDVLNIGCGSTPPYDNNAVYYYQSAWTVQNTNIIFTVTDDTIVYIPILDVFSESDSHTAWSGTGDPHPWPSGNAVTYTFQSALDPDIYYWRVRGKDPLGSNTWGAWSLGSGSLGYQSFTVNVPPTVALGTPTNNATIPDTTPDLTFTGTDGNLDEIEYNVQIATNSDFSAIPVFDAVSSNYHTSAGTTLTWSHTIGSGTNRMLIVGVAMRATTVSGITYNGVALTKIRSDRPGSDVDSELWYLPEASLPSTGTYDVVVTGSVSQQWIAGAVSYSGVSQLGDNFGTSVVSPTTSSSLNVTTLADEVVVDIISLQSSNGTLAADASQNERWDLQSSVGRGGMSTETAVGATTNMAWTFLNDYYATSAVVLKGGIVSKFSTSDTGFSGTGDPHPWPSGNTITYTVQSALTPGTYYWRVSGKDPDGTNTYGAWSSPVWSFTINSFQQSSYRWFNNNNSTSIGSPIVAQNTAMTTQTPVQGTPFRLRILLHIGGGTLSSSGQNLKLQIATKVGAECNTNMATTDESYSDLLTSSGAIRYYNNASAADNAALTADGTNDPTHNSDTKVTQTYKDLDGSDGNINFTNSQGSIPSGQDGEWDFAIVDNSATNETTYCVRIVKADNTVLDTYSVVPEFTTVPENPILLLGLFPVLAGFLKRLKKKKNESKK